MTTPERSVEEIVEEFETKVSTYEEKWQNKFLDEGTKKGLGDLSMMIGVVSEILQAERQKREEVVEAERERFINLLIFEETDCDEHGYCTGLDSQGNRIGHKEMQIRSKFLNSLPQPNNPKL